jgi:NAD+ diphosphatase
MGPGEGFTQKRTRILGISGTMTFTKEIREGRIEESRAYWFVFKNNNLLVKSNNNKFSIPYGKQSDLAKSSEELPPIYLGKYNTISCYVTEATEKISTNKNMAFHNLWDVYKKLDHDFCQIANHAVQIVNWDKIFQFCGGCGSRTSNLDKERAKICSTCGLINYPRISPAVIVAVIKKNKLLLARSRRFKKKLYSVLAGFVEPGESLEECIEREIFEEVGIKVKNIRYFGSQPWPFPDSLMIGFIAEYKSGQITINEEEIQNAEWFEASKLPEIPTKISIARQLIDWFIDHSKKGQQQI